MGANWTEENGTLNVVFTFVDFKSALEFVNRVGAIAEEHAHHPDICIKNYNQVHLSTSTHDAGNTVTDKDRQLAEAISKLL